MSRARGRYGFLRWEKRKVYSAITGVPLLRTHVACITATCAFALFVVRPRKKSLYEHPSSRTDGQRRSAGFSLFVRPSRRPASVSDATIPSRPSLARFTPPDVAALRDALRARKSSSRTFLGDHDETPNAPEFRIFPTRSFFFSNTSGSFERMEVDRINVVSWRSVGRRWTLLPRNSSVHRAFRK